MTEKMEDGEIWEILGRKKDLGQRRASDDNWGMYGANAVLISAWCRSEQQDLREDLIVDQNWANACKSPSRGQM